MKNEIIKNEELIRLAYSKNIKVHILLNNGSWRNGFVKDISSVDFFTFDDTENGLEPFFYVQLKSVDPYIVRGVGK